MKNSKLPVIIKLVDSIHIARTQALLHLCIRSGAHIPPCISIHHAGKTHVHTDTYTTTHTYRYIYLCEQYINPQNIYMVLSMKEYCIRVGLTILHDIGRASKYINAYCGILYIPAIYGRQYRRVLIHRVVLHLHWENFIVFLDVGSDLTFIY